MDEALELGAPGQNGRNAFHWKGLTADSRFDIVGFPVGLLPARRGEAKIAAPWGKSPPPPAYRDLSFL